MNIPPFTWIEIKEGNPLPEIGEVVLWRMDDGYLFFDAFHDYNCNHATHWMKILQPEEMKSQSTEQWIL